MTQTDMIEILITDVQMRIEMVLLCCRISLEDHKVTNEPMFSKSLSEFCLILRIYRWMMITIGEIETLIEIMAEIDMTEIETTGIGLKMIVTNLMMIDVASEITAMTTTETLVIKIIRIQSAKKEKEAIITATTTTI